MALTAQLFQQIMKSLKSDQGRRQNEQRAKPRVGVHGRAELRCLPLTPGSKQKISVWVRDLSANGIGILHSKPLKAGTRFVITFPHPNEEHLNVVYIVAHTAEVSKGLYAVGARMFGNPTVSVAA